MTVHVYVYENTITTLWFESLVICEGGPWVLIKEYDKEIPDPVGPGGTTDYNALSNLPKINDVLLKGNKTSEQLNIKGGVSDWNEITNKPNDLVQDPNYQHTDCNYTQADKTKLENVYTKAETDQKIIDELDTFDKLDYQIVTELPATGAAGIRYLVKHPTDAQYEEYIYVNDKWHDIGSTSDVDLSNYYNKAETDTLLANKQDKMTIDTLLDDKSTNPVQNKAIAETIGNIGIAFSGFREQTEQAIQDLDDAIANMPVLKIYGAAADDQGINAGARKNIAIQVIPTTDEYQIVGYKRVFIDNATNDGTNRDYITLQSISTGGGSKQSMIAVRNEGNAAAKIKVSVECLCMARSL